MAGFRIAAALEINPHRCAVYEKNLRLRPIQMDVRKVSAREILKNAGLRKGSKFCVVGCPPCQSFSKLSDTRMVDTKNDPRSGFVSRFANLVVGMMPMAIVFENVSWMVRGPGRKFFDEYLGILRGAGYYTIHNIINASDMGVPQNRKRVVAVSVRKKFLNADMVRQLGQFHQAASGRKKTVRDAIHDLRPLQSGERDDDDPLHFTRSHTERVLEMITHVPKDGGSRKSMPERLWLDCHKRLANGGAGTSYGRMWWDRPSPTMTRRCTSPACGRFIHPEQDRGITLREAARLQTIPDTFDFGGDTTEEIQEMIGDGVPVDMAAHMGMRLMQILTS